MADEFQLKLLRRGVSRWNQWRQEHPLIRPDLREASLIGANLRNAKFGPPSPEFPVSMSNSHAPPSCYADFYHADLTSADLRGADLSFADLTWAHLANTDLRAANLTGARLWFTEFYRTELANAQLGGASLGWAKFANTDLILVIGLGDLKHAGPSSIGIDTIYRSEGGIPASFLRGAGVPESFIVQANRLATVSSTVEFHSCFISYSSQDQEFVERLHNDMQNKGVRCWFAPKDLAIGSETRSGIDDAIRNHDKLLVVLSESSVKSPWVKKEVETAFEKERQYDRIVLFPIRLDDTVMETGEAWASDIRRMRNIGDFRGWKNAIEYKRAFDRLLSDLTAGEPHHSGNKFLAKRKLSKAEELVLQGTVEGLNKKEIACIAGVSMRTLSRIRGRLGNKLGLSKLKNSSEV
jgi:hypothetical protein